MLAGCMHACVGRSAQLSHCTVVVLCMACALVIHVFHKTDFLLNTKLDLLTNRLVTVRRLYLGRRLHAKFAWSRCTENCGWNGSGPQITG